jgi:hypothetical protein
VPVRVYRWKNYLDVQVGVSVQPGQGGVCGIFNGNQADDTAQAVIPRIGARVRACEDLLTGKALIEFASQMAKMPAAGCSAMCQASAQAMCRASLGVAAWDILVKSCTFEECFGRNVRARSRAKPASERGLWHLVASVPAAAGLSTRTGLGEPWLPPGIAAGGLNR